MFGEYSPDLSERVPISELISRLSIEEKSLIREYAKAYFFSSQEYVLPVISVFEDPIFKFKLKQRTFDTIEELADFICEYVENKYGIYRGFTYNFYVIILNTILRAKATYPKIWYLIDLGILNERFLIIAGKDVVRGITALNNDKSLYQLVAEKVKERKVLSRDDKTLVEVTLLVGIGKYEDALNRLKMLKGAFFEDYMTPIATSIKTISAILFNYIPEYSVDLSGTNLKERIVSKLWMAILDMLEKGRKTDMNEYKDIIKYEIHELIGISPWIYPLSDITKSFWEILNSRLSEAEKILQNAYSLVPKYPPILKAVISSILTVVSERVSEDSVYRERVRALMNIYRKIRSSNEIFANISRLLLYSFGQITEDDLKNLEENIPEGAKILHSIYSKETRPRHEHTLKYFLALSYLKESNMLCEMGRHNNAIEKANKALELSRQLDIPHFVINSTYLYIKSKLKQMEAMSSRMRMQELTTNFYDLFKLYNEIKEMVHNISDPNVKMIIFDLGDEIKIFARAKGINLNVISSKFKKREEKIREYLDL